MKNLFRSGKKKLVSLFLMVTILSFGAMNVSAVGTANVDVTAAFTQLKEDIVLTLGVVAGFAVVVMGIFLAWKYGRKIFSQVAK